MTLRNGPDIRDSAIALACDLEARHFHVTAANGALSVSPASRLTAEDRAAIMREKQFLISIVEYCQSGACDA